jgi:hypothetical protein
MVVNGSGVVQGEPIEAPEVAPGRGDPDDPGEGENDSDGVSAVGSGMPCGSQPP